MSRSYRKPWITDGYGTKWRRYAKKEANRKVRRHDDVPNGKAYRKVSDPWSICDYKFFISKADKELGIKFFTYETAIRK